MQNKYNNDPGKLAAWLSASHTEKAPKKKAPPTPIPQGEGGLSQDSVALCHQVTTPDRSKLKQRLGELSEAKMLEIERGLKAAMDMI